MASKPGKHGTLHLYQVSYRDKADHDNAHSCKLWGYNVDHVEMRFYEGEDADGWEIVSIARAK